jgi:SPP1 gp7 family putative phage head morphogenesis protein
MEDPTFSRTDRDDYTAFLVGMNQKYHGWVENLIESILNEPEPKMFAKAATSYHSEKIIRSLTTKISDEEKRVIYRTIAYQTQKGAALALQQVKHPMRKQRGVTGQYINQGTVNELYTINVRQVTSIQNDYIKNLELLIARFIGGGTLSWDKLKKGIKELGVMSDQRAELIARTEVIRAISTGQKEALLMSGKKRWKWVTAMDERVCKICGLIEGKVVDIGSPFITIKGDPITNSPAHVNCRCSQEVVP